MSTEMRFVTDYPVHSGEYSDPATLVRVARALDAAGVDGMGFTDHPAPSGKWLEGGGHETFDPFAAMAFSAAATERIILFSHLIVVPYRNPLLQANSMATVDVLAGGRTIFALGAGYLRSEFAALGVEFDERNALFDEGVDIIRRALSGEDVHYEGIHFQARGQRLRPLPVQRPHPPLWVGGNSSVAMRRVAEWADGWTAMIAPAAMSATARTRTIESVEQLATAVSQIHSLAAEHGRDPQSIAISAGDPRFGPATGRSADEQLATLRQLRAAGVSWARFDPGPGTADEMLERLEEFASTVVRPARSEGL